MSLRDHPTYAKSIRYWLQVCDAHHEDTCVSPPISQRSPDQVPEWIIDTQEGCITPGTSAHRYVALSYTWPESDSTSRPLQLDRHSLAYFRTPGCLYNSQVSSALPKVIRDAIQLTRSIRERYLWVDRLCIVQDDADTVSQVQRMDEVYSGAYLTIIAAATLGLYDVNSSYGRPEHKDLDYSNHHWLEDRERIQAIMEGHYESLSKSKWATRGWTYQEQILCRRAVFFLDTRIFWDCQCSIWDEGALKPSRNDATTTPRSVMARRLASLRQPDFSAYVDLACPYNGRDLSYPQDALLAFSGILNSLRPSFPGGFVYGLPRMFLDHALIWQPFGKATRRFDRERGSHAAFKTSSLSSWCWSGWQCLIDPYSLRSGLAYNDDSECQERAASWKTRSLVEWRTMSTNRGTKSSSPLLPTDSSSPPRISTIDTPFLTCVTTRVFLRPGAVLTPTGSRWYEARQKISVFEHPQFINGPEDEDVLSVLVLQDAQHEPAGLLRLMKDETINFDGQIELIAMSTGSVKRQDLVTSFEEKVYYSEQVRWENPHRFPVHFRPSQINDDFTLPELSRRRALMDKGCHASDDDGGNSKGAVLVKLIQWGLNHFLGPGGETGEDDTRGVNNGWFGDNKQDEDEDSLEDGPEILYHFYNVLWIERRNGVAYRRACGRVPRSVWEANASRPTKIILG